MIPIITTFQNRAFWRSGLKYQEDGKMGNTAVSCAPFPVKLIISERGNAPLLFFPSLRISGFKDGGLFEERLDVKITSSVTISLPNL